MDRSSARRRARAAAGSLALIPALLTLGGCGGPTVEAPADKGVCWTMDADKAGKISFHKLSSNIPDMEHCAANIEAVRERFLNLGGSHKEMDGAYQGTFIFAQPDGIFTAPDLGKAPYRALVRTPDGRLVPPGAASQQP